MSEKDGTASNEARDGADQDSVFDFLYHDSRRIASFLSQFDNNGLLTGITQADSVTKGARRGKKFGLGANAPILGGGNLEFEIGPGEAGSQSLERIYDPYWTNARLFLDVLTERNMIQRNLNEADIGQFVLAKGWLTVLDLAMFKDAWKLSSLQKKIREGMYQKPKSTMTAVQKAQIKEEKDNAELMLDMIQIMPHSVHASMITSAENAHSLLWCTLNEEYLVTPASNITLAHGATMPGEWAFVGILSAKPEYQIPDLNSEVEDANPGLMQSLIGQVSRTIAPIVRIALGRPTAAYAITPLLIFREVS